MTFRPQNHRISQSQYTEVVSHITDVVAVMIGTGFEVEFAYVLLFCSQVIRQVFRRKRNLSLKEANCEVG